MPSKSWLLILPILIVLFVNTTTKNHVCDHEVNTQFRRLLLERNDQIDKAPISAEERVQLSPEIRNRMVKALEFKTISVEAGMEDIYSNEFVGFWNYIYEQYPRIFSSQDPDVQVDRIEFQDGKETIVVSEFISK